MIKKITKMFFPLILTTIVLLGFMNKYKSSADDSVRKEPLFVVLEDFLKSYGSFPKDSDDYISHTFAMINSGVFATRDEAFKDVADYDPVNGQRTLRYIFKDIRPNGQSIYSAKPKGTRDVIGYKLDDDFELAGINPGSYAIIISDTLKKEIIPQDLTMVSIMPNGKQRIVFPNEPSVGFDTLNSQEYWIYKNGSIPLIQNEGNGGVDSLIELSRRLNFPDIYGVNWHSVLEASGKNQIDSNLQEVQLLSQKLSLSTQVEKLKISDLQQRGSTAILFLSDDGRLVTLLSLDDDRAVVIDRGVTRNVERSVLEKRYSGEALVPTKALTQNAAIVADDAVRELKLPSLDAEVPQQFVLRNTGTTPITLQLEYPLLGVTESKLSRDVIPPGETATLDLKVKWRSILKAPYQNVLVSIQTNDPIVPRLQLAILLTPPAQAGN